VCDTFDGISEDEAKVAAIHHYSKSFWGFSAVLTPEQASLLQGQLNSYPYIEPFQYAS